MRNYINGSWRIISKLYVLVIQEDVILENLIKNENLNYEKSYQKE